MKTSKLFLSAALALGIFAISATPVKESKVQCGVSNAQIISYLENGPHHHTVYSVSDIRGTCNSSATIEEGFISTVYVVDGIVVAHTDPSM